MDTVKSCSKCGNLSSIVKFPKKGRVCTSCCSKRSVEYSRKNKEKRQEILKKYNNIYMMGGGINECLKEIEIALKALNKPYELNKKYCY